MQLGRAAAHSHGGDSTPARCVINTQQGCPGYHDAHTLTADLSVSLPLSKFFFSSQMISGLFSSFVNVLLPLVRTQDRAFLSVCMGII